MMYFPDSNLSLEVSGSMEDVGLDSVTGRDLGDRQRTGGKMTYKLSKGIRFLADLNLTADRIPQKREQVNWKTEISFRVRQNMNFFLDFSKFETVFPDEREWDSVTSRGGFRLEAQI
jgi:hypothetical protein